MSWDGLIKHNRIHINVARGRLVDLMQHVSIWKFCEHPKTPENTIAHGAKSTRCRICHNQRERDRYRQNHPMCKFRF